MSAEGLESLQDSLGSILTLERELGSGGMATVYLALDLKHHRRVALKVLHPDLAASLGAERFRREIEIASNLQHPHILSVFDSGVTASGQLWFTMPYVEGETLRSRLRREKQLPVEDALRITRDIASALSYAHEHGTIHRDIKPENILLTTEGEALLADFGIARSLAAVASAGTAPLTATGLAVGTPQYMSPEQASGDPDIGVRSDIYSLGAVCYEMITGEPPFTGATAQVVVAKMLGSEAPSARRLRPVLSERADSVLRKALAPVPADRYATAADFAHALTAAERVQRASRQTTVPAMARQWWRGIPTGATLFGLGLLIGAGVLFAWRSRERARVAPDRGAVRIVVIPFENLGDSADAYFADGLTDAVRDKLAGVPGLEVIGSISSGQYRGTSKTPRQIGQELGVQYLLVGKVQWDKARDGTSRVKVTPELVDASTATAKWAEPSDAPLTDVFQVQAKIAERVVRELQVALTPSVEHALSARPTADLAAYDAYLRGDEVLQSGNSPAILKRAAIFFRGAVELDSTFALAWAELAIATALYYVNGVPSIAAADSADRSSARALALAPELPEPHTARAAYYSLVRSDFAAALREDSAALDLAPSDARTLRRTAFAERALGRWDAAVAHLQQAARLDPRDARAAEALGEAELRHRHLPEAQRALDRALALKPTLLSAVDERMMVSLAQGDLASARRVLHEVPPALDSAAVIAFLSQYFDLGWALDSASTQRLLALGPDAFNGDRASWGLVLAQQYSFRGDQQRARAYGDTARRAFEAQLAKAPDDPQRLAELGLALAYVGRKRDAIRQGERSVALLPSTKDHYIGPYLQHQLVRIYVLAGEHGKALDALEPLLQMPYYLTPAWLKIDPNFASLRGQPRFERLIAAASPVT